MFQDIMCIVKKELARVFTDKKLMFTTFVLPALSLVMIYSVMGIMLKDMVDDRKQHESQIVFIDAPQSFEKHVNSHLKEFNIQMTQGRLAEIEQYKKDIFEGRLDSLVVFEKHFDETIASYESGVKFPQIEVYYNPTEDYSQEAYNKLEDKILKTYETNLLVSRFGNESYLKAFSVNQDQKTYALAPIEKMSGDAFSGFLPMLLSIFLFSGGMGIGIDLIAGEKERGTMATLLVTPIRREAIAFGKIISLGIVSLISTASSLAGMLISLPMIMNAEGGAETAAAKSQMFLLSPVGMVQFLVLCIVLSAIYVGIICVVSVYANSIKEAGTLVTPAYLVVMMIGVMTAFTTGQPGAAEIAIPLYGCIMAMKLALTGELSWLFFGITCLSSAVIVVAIVYLIRYMFNSEKIMFGA